MLQYIFLKGIEMYHIVFNVNEDYIKYLSVLLYSLIKNTAKDTTKKRGGGMIV